jgi:hypothetical protein
MNAASLTTPIKKETFLHYLALICLFGVVFLFSFRQLSDPDLGFHLNAGAWIATNHAVPDKDIATYTVIDHDYIDLHWLFQLSVYGVYTLFGYSGLSLFVCLLVVTLFVLLFFRLKKKGCRDYLSIILLLAAVLIIEPRILLRPELFTFLYITLMLMVLEQWVKGGKNLWLLPVIMLLWCNTQALFILGFGLMGSYVVGLWIKQAKPNLSLITWSCLALLICFSNPYGINGLLFPFELLTRFGEGNVFHEHIKEFQTLFSLRNWTLKEFLFVAYGAATILGFVLTWKKRKLYEGILLVVFLILALLAIRNIPLFVVVSLPITGAALNDIIVSVHERTTPGTGRRNKVPWMKTRGMIVMWLDTHRGRIKNWLYVAMIVFCFGLITSIITNNYYPANYAYNKTGTGLDRFQQPEDAAQFLQENNLDQRIINSLSFGGWLSWRLKQPVFIDARLEVMKEPLYQEVVDSWHGDLHQMIQKYKAELIVYDYLRYHTWTTQLLFLPEWEPVYLDGLSVVWAKKKLPHPTGIVVPGRYDHLIGSPSIHPYQSIEEKERVLEQPIETGFLAWLNGLFHPLDPNARSLQNMASFMLQSGQFNEAEIFFLAALECANGRHPEIYFALEAIYKVKGYNNLAIKCSGKYKNTKLMASIEPDKESSIPPLGTNITAKAACLAEAGAVMHFNNGNAMYHQGDINGAIQEYTRAIKLNPNYAKAYNNRGMVKAVNLQDYQEALKDFDTAISIDPAYADAYLGRGSLRMALHDEPGAVEDWKKAEKLGNNQAKILISKHFNE